MLFDGTPQGTVARRAHRGATAQLVLDKISVPAFRAFSYSRKLRSAYTGPAFRGQKVPTVNTVDVGFTGNNVDHASGLAWAAGSEVRVLLLYDQSTNAGHLGCSADANFQPRMYASGVTDAMPNAVPAARFMGTNDYLQADEGSAFLSLTGSPGLTIGIAFSRVSGDNRLFEFGSGATNFASVIVDHETARPAFIGMRGGGSRVFTTGTTLATPKWWIVKIGAGAAVGSWQIEEDGVDLTQASVSFSGNTLSFTGAASQNITLGNWNNADDGFVGHIAAFFVWTSLLGASDLALLRTELDNYA